MSNLREAAQLALAILEFPTHYAPWTIDKVVVDLCAALAQLDDKAQLVAYEWLTPNKNGTWRGNLGYEPPTNGAGYKNVRPLYAAPQPPAEQGVTLGGGFPGDHNGTKAALREDALERLWNAHWNALKSMSDEDINKLDEQGAELSDDKAFLEWITDTLIELNPSNYDHDDALPMLCCIHRSDPCDPKATGRPCSARGCGMTIDRETVIRLAREADPGFDGGPDADGTMNDSLVGLVAIERFAALVLEHGRKPLTDEQIMNVCYSVWATHPIEVARAIEAAHGITNKESNDAEPS